MGVCFLKMKVSSKMVVPFFKIKICFLKMEVCFKEIGVFYVKGCLLYENGSFFRK